MKRYLKTILWIIFLLFIIVLVWTQMQKPPKKLTWDYDYLRTDSTAISPDSLYFEVFHSTMYDSGYALLDTTWQLYLDFRQLHPELYDDRVHYFYCVAVEIRYLLGKIRSAPSDTIWHYFPYIEPNPPKNLRVIK